MLPPCVTESRRLVRSWGWGASRRTGLRSYFVTQARRIRLTVTAGDEETAAASSHQSSHTLTHTDGVLHFASVR